MFTTIVETKVNPFPMSSILSVEMPEQAFGIDVSRYNGEVNWEIAKEHGVVFAGMRASISWGYRDPWISRNLSECERLGIYTLPYHVFYPGENFQRQAENFYAAVGKKRCVPVIDVELDHGKSPKEITTTLRDFLSAIEYLFGTRSIIYSSANWINEHINIGLYSNWVDREIWWLAHYLNTPTERPSPPALPDGVTNWLIHQNCGKFPAWPGLNNGKDAIKTVDTNRWNGTVRDVIDFFSRVETKPTLSWEESIDNWARDNGYEGPEPSKS